MTWKFPALFAFWTLLCCGLAALSADRPAPAPAAKLKAEQPEDITGYYACRGGGTEAGKGYTGVCLIEAIEGDANSYTVLWSTGGHVTLGVGLRRGDLLTVGWAHRGEHNDGITRGVTVYQIKGKILEGRYLAIPGAGKALPETLRRLKRLRDDA